MRARFRFPDTLQTEGVRHTAETPELAIAGLREWAANYRETIGTRKLNSKSTLADLMEGWTKHWLKVEERTPGTINTNRTTTRKLLKCFGAGRLLEDIDPDIVDEIIEKLHHEFPAQSRAVHNLIVRALTWGQSRGAVDRTWHYPKATTKPSYRPRWVKENDGRPITYSPRQILDFQRALREYRTLVTPANGKTPYYLPQHRTPYYAILADMVCLQFAVCLRASEALALTADCVRWDEEIGCYFVDVRHSLVHNAGKPFLGPTKTKSSLRELPALPEFNEVISRLLHEARKTGENTALLRTPKRRFADHGTIYRQLRIFRENAAELGLIDGMENLKLHQVRKSSATFIRNEHSRDVARIFLGQREGSTVTDDYVGSKQVIDQARIAAVAAIGAHMALAPEAYADDEQDDDPNFDWAA
ncbi:hypothetical protein [Gryllotalpicola protaetiae]|uniref:hypothetical protein n=1 Tax=Gryllotalpicola protaetiae TaxID=2419771 RepID=UPI0013C507FF|nr:hypothetical protein [Gryllotalpicola protaetiae]